MAPVLRRHFQLPDLLDHVLEIAKADDRVAALMIIRPEAIADLDLANGVLVGSGLYTADTVLAEFLQIGHNRPPTLAQRLYQIPMIGTQQTGAAVGFQTEMNVDLERPIRQQSERTRHFTTSSKPAAGVLQLSDALIHGRVLRRRISSRSRFSASPCRAIVLSREISLAIGTSLGTRLR